MITYIVGELTDIEDNIITVEAYGVGYEIMVPASMIPMLEGIGSHIKIYTYQNVKEEALDLFGFISKDDLRIFKLLITVNGIGPKGALSILSVMTPDEVRFAVLADDVKKIQSAPGIGGKTAQKLIIELKDKLSAEDLTGVGNKENTAVVASNYKDEHSEALEALVALGYSRNEAYRAVNTIEINDTMTAEDILKKSLKQLLK